MLASLSKLPRAALPIPERCRHLLHTLSADITREITSNGSWGPFGKGGRISGSVAPGWEDVRDAFESNFRNNLELGAQLVVYKGGTPVVDLHGYSDAMEGLGYNADTLQNVFSSGKNMEALACMVLVDRGLLKYNDRISSHWKSFGQHGKGDIRVEEVLRHESGLQFFVNPAFPDDFSKNLVPSVADVSSTENGAVERVIERCAPWGRGRRLYHASTRGFIIGGLVRQITGKTLGDFLRSEVTGPLGISLFCGTPRDEQARHHYVDMRRAGALHTLRAIVPAMLGIGGDMQAWSFVKKVVAAMRDSKHPLRGYPKAIPLEWAKDDVKHVNTVEGRTLEVSSGAMQGNARALAKVSALLANGGKIDGVRIVSEETVRLALSDAKVLRDDVWGMTMAFTCGGFADFGSMTELSGVPCDNLAQLQRGFVGWAGKGGSLFLWDVERNIGFAYVMNGMDLGLVGGPRAKPLLAVLSRKQ